ncbi:MAG: type II secretion system protein [Candidatus Nanopelagicales bacterium]
MKLREDSGITLVEVLVTTAMIGVASSLMLSGLTDAIGVMTRADDTNRGLFDAKVVLDRLARDVRQGRAVVCDGGLAQLDDPSSADPLCASHLQLWIDYDSDYAQDPDEVVTWRLARSADGEHYDVIRYQGASDTVGRIQATSLIVRTLFTYDTPTPAAASTVTLTMQYDALVGRGTELKVAKVTTKLRNKAG